LRLTILIAVGPGGNRPPRSERAVQDKRRGNFIERAARDHRFPLPHDTPPASSTGSPPRCPLVDSLRRFEIDRSNVLLRLARSPHTVSPRDAPPTTHARENGLETTQTPCLSDVRAGATIPGAMSEPLRLTIVYEDAGDGDGWVVARIPQVRGAISQGATRAQARENVIDALRELLAVRLENPENSAECQVLQDLFTKRSRTTKERGSEDASLSPIGRTHAEASHARAERSETYRDARAEYVYFRELRKTHPIAAHLRERRFELGLTQDEVARAAGTSHSAISRMEKGTFLPKLSTLQRIAMVLDEELLVCFSHKAGDEVEHEHAGIA